MGHLIVTKIDYFNAAVRFNLEPQNDGQGPHQTLGDAGGLTTWGLTYVSWVSWQRDHGEFFSPDAFKTLRIEEVYPLYRMRYWDACHCDDFGPVGIAVFDTAVLSGPQRAMGLLQSSVGVKPDGLWGPVTLAGFRAMSLPYANDTLCNKRISFYDSIDPGRRWPGWRRRAVACRQLVAGFLLQELQV
jgi:lysozyme family protein